MGSRPTRPLRTSPFEGGVEPSPAHRPLTVCGRSKARSARLFQAAVALKSPSCCFSTMLFNASCRPRAVHRHQVVGLRLARDHRTFRGRRCNAGPTSWARSGRRQISIIAHYPFIRSSKYLTARAQGAGNGHSARWMSHKVSTTGDPHSTTSILYCCANAARA